MDRAGVEPATPGFSVCCREVPNDKAPTTLEQAGNLGYPAGYANPPETPLAAPALGLPTDPDLALIVRQWESLPLALKAGMVAMVKAAAQPGCTG